MAFVEWLWVIYLALSGILSLIVVGRQCLYACRHTVYLNDWALATSSRPKLNSAIRYSVALDICFVCDCISFICLAPVARHTYSHSQPQPTHQHPDRYTQWPFSFQHEVDMANGTHTKSFSVFSAFFLFHSLRSETYTSTVSVSVCTVTFQMSGYLKPLTNFGRIRKNVSNDNVNVDLHIFKMCAPRRGFNCRPSCCTCTGFTVSA